MKFWSIPLLFAAALLGARGIYSYEKSTSLSGAAEVVTVHLASGSNRTVKFVGASVYCSVACTFTLERNGTAPTGTAGTVIGDWNGSTNATGATVYHTSDTSSTTVGKTYNVAAGEEKTIGLPDVGLRAGQNLTIRTSSITGTARIYFQWQEF